MTIDLTDAGETLESGVYKMLEILHCGRRGTMKKRRKMFYLTEEEVAMAKERARQFKIPMSRHIGRLISDDYKSGKSVIMIVAEQSPKYRKFLQENPPEGDQPK